MPKNDGKPWTSEDVKTLRQQARDRNDSTGRDRQEPLSDSCGGTHRGSAKVSR
jgi:hypothetical protein